MEGIILKPFYFTTSWDDGFPEDIRLADMLSAHGIRGTFYVPRSWQRPVMAPHHVRALAAQFEIGAHTLHHVILTDLPAAKAADEISGSKRWLEDLTGQRCSTFCFPSGKYSPEHVAMVRLEGFDGARTVQLCSLALPSSKDGLVLLGTTLQVFPHSSFVYLRNALKWGTPRNLFLYALPGRAATSWGDLARRLLSYAAENGGVFHLWGHSWEIAERNLWGDLEDLLSFTRSLARQPQYVTNSELCSIAHSS